MYGGYDINNNPVSDDLVVLDITQTTFTWSRANVSTTSPLSRFYHSATLVGDYMIVAFGRNNVYLPSPETNEIFILYTGNKSDYKWVNEFIPPVPPPVPPSNPSMPSTPSTTSTTSTPNSGEKNNNKSTNRNLIIGVVILSTVFALIGGLFLIRLYRKRRRSQQYHNQMYSTW